MGNNKAGHCRMWETRWNVWNVFMCIFIYFLKQPLAYRASVSIDWATATVTTLLELDLLIYIYITLQLTTNERKTPQSRSVLNWFGLLVLFSDWAQTLQMHWLREKKGGDISILEKRRILRRRDVHKRSVSYAQFDVQSGAFYARSWKAQ